MKIDLIEGDSVIAGVLDKRALLQSALLKAPFQFLGGCAILEWAFGDFIRSNGQLPVNPYFPTGIVGVVVVYYVMLLITKAFVGPLVWYRYLKHHEKRCLKRWDKEVVDYFMKAQGPHREP